MLALMHGQVALLMAPAGSLEAGHFVRHVGTLSGTPFGGLSGMYHALGLGPQPAAAASTAAVTQAAASQAAQGAAAAEDGVAAAQPGGDTSGAAAAKEPAPAQRALRQVSAKEKMVRSFQTAQLRLQSIPEQVAEDDSRCLLLAAHARQFDLACQRTLAATVPAGGSAAAALSLQVNPAARQGWTLKRAKSCLELAKRRNRQRYVQREPLAGGSPGKAPPLPLHRPPAVKRVPVMQLVSRQTEQQARKAEAASIAASAGPHKAGRRKRCKPATAQQENLAPGSTSCGTAAATSCAAEPLGVHDMQQYVTTGDATRSAAGDHGADHAEERGHKRVRKTPAWQRDFASGEDC